MEPIAGNLSSLRPMKRPKEYYSANDYFIVRLLPNLRGSGEPEFHIGKDIFNKSNRYADWEGNEVVSRMQKKYCFSPTNIHLDMTVKSSPFSYEAMTPRFPPASSCSTPQTASQMQTTKWPASHMAPTIAPVTHYPNPVQIYNPSCFNGHISDAQNASGTFLHNEKNKFNNDQNNVFCPRPQARSNSEPFTEFSGRHSPCNQRKDAQSEFKHLNPPEREEIPQRVQRSKLVSSLQYYQNEKRLVATLQRKSPRCIIFVDLRHHKRFLHNLSQCLPSHIHVITYFDPSYKFPIFANAPLEQLVKTECFHIHPDSNTRNKLKSQEYLTQIISRTHRDLPLRVKFVLLTGSNPVISGTISNLQNTGRPVVAFLPDFDFPDFYSVLKNDETNKSIS